MMTRQTINKIITYVTHFVLDTSKKIAIQSFVLFETAPHVVLHYQHLTLTDVSPRGCVIYPLNSLRAACASELI